RRGRRQLDPRFDAEYSWCRYAHLRVPLHPVRYPLHAGRDHRRARAAAPRVPPVPLARRRAAALGVLRENDPQELIAPMFERVRAALKAALDAATPPHDLKDLARQMREAVVEAKVAVRELAEALKRTEVELAAERQRLADAERRG